MEVQDINQSICAENCVIYGASITADQALFRAVISQAISDVMSLNPKFDREKYEAQRWLFHNQNDFFRVCDMAGLNPEYVRAKVKRFFDE